MASFQKVMQQWKRMCNSYYGDCDKCKRYDRDTCLLKPLDWNEKAILRAEKDVWQWVEKNPEPTWLEWLHEQLPELNGCEDYQVVYTLATNPVPKEILEKSN